MLSYLQNLQDIIGTFVIPLLIALGGLLIAIVLFHLTVILLNIRGRKSISNFKKELKKSLDKEQAGDDREFQPELKEDSRKHRDHFIEVTLETDLPSVRYYNLYDSLDFLEEDLRELSSKTWWKRAQSLYRLKYVSPKDIKKKLDSLAYDKSHNVRLIALDSLSHFDNPPDLNPLKLFESFSEILDTFLVMKLLPLEPSKTFVLPLVESDKSRFRRIGATLMGQPEEKYFIPLLRKLTTDKEGLVRKKATESLGIIGHEDALEILKRTSQDGKSVVRRASARALGNFPADDSIGTLDRLAEDNNFEVRLSAFNSLSDFGNAGREIIGKHWKENKRLAREAIFESYQE